MKTEIKHWTHTDDKKTYHGEFRSIESTLWAAANYYNEGEFFFLCSVHDSTISDFFNAENLVEDLKCQALDSIGELDFWLHGLSDEENFNFNSMVSKTLLDWAVRHDREPSFIGLKELGFYSIKKGEAVLADKEEVINND